MIVAHYEENVGTWVGLRNGEARDEGGTSYDDCRKDADALYNTTSEQT